MRYSGMANLDKLSLVGAVIAVVAIFGGQLLEGGSIESLLDASAFLIVVGGSFGAAMLQSNAGEFIHAMKIFRWVINPPIPPVRQGIEQIGKWSSIARHKGLLGLEKSIDSKIDGFLLKGLNMLIDGNDADAIRKAMYIEVDARDSELLKAAKIYESIGGYSPTLGIVGAVLGLIHVMGNLANPELLGAGIATAFVATIYGVGFANLFFLPVYHKLRGIIVRQSKYREMMVEGIAFIAEGENPRVIANKLSGYLSENNSH